VLTFIVVCSASGNEVMLLMPTSAELTNTCVDERGVVSLPLLVEDASVPYVDRCGVLIFTVVCSITKNKVLSLMPTSAELTDTCVDKRGVV